jgi:Tol biopolymer transport system component
MARRSSSDRADGDEEAIEMRRDHGRILNGFAAALLLLAACDSAAETPTANEGRIEGRLLYEVYAGGFTSALHWIDAAGGSPRDLGVDTDPSAVWSPDGTRILTTSTAGPPETAKPIRPATLSADGSDFRLLDGVEDRLFNLACTAFSPDGSLLACQGFSDFELGVYTVRASDGGGLRALTDFNGVPGDFSPDGERIVFLGGDSESTTYAEDLGTLYVMGIDGSGLREITPPSSVLAYTSASWSPDGEWIAFIGGDGSLRLVRPDGTGLHEVALSDDFSIEEAAGGATWSPDGAWLAFAARQVGREAPDLYLVRLSGTGLTQVADVRQVTDTPDVAEFTHDWTS